jgi:hypothetical protein
VSTHFAYRVSTQFTWHILAALCSRSVDHRTGLFPCCCDSSAEILTQAATPATIAQAQAAGVHQHTNLTPAASTSSSAASSNSAMYTADLALLLRFMQFRTQNPLACCLAPVTAAIPHLHAIGHYMYLVPCNELYTCVCAQLPPPRKHQQQMQGDYTRCTDL